jgi:hypothetical protein
MNIHGKKATIEEAFAERAFMKLKSEQEFINKILGFLFGMTGMKTIFLYRCLVG